MKRVFKIGLISVGLVAAGLALLNAKSVTAHFMPRETVTTVEIDGVNFGKFDRIDGLSRLGAHHDSVSQLTITLGRDFVTDPSLYLWARNAVSQRIGLRDVKLVESTLAGEVVRRYTLSLCQPISWTVETAAPGAGGFHETVRLAVQNFSVH